MADILNAIFISELLVDNAGGSAIDTDGDGSTNKSDEFIELQNASGQTVSLDGYEIWSEKGGLLFSFGASDTLAGGQTATVVGNYTGTPPAGYYSAGISEGTNWLPDGEQQKFDSIFLVDTNTGDYIVLSYGDPVRAPTLPSGFTGTNQVGSGETIESNGPNGVAFTRDENGDLIEAPPTPGQPDIPCFVQGTRVTTKRGDIAVEDLVPGDFILTKDSGYVPLIGVGRFAPTREDLRRRPELAPVMIGQGSIGNTRDLALSASHRVLIAGAQAELLFGDAEVLASARQCAGHRAVRVVPSTIPPVYFHLLLNRHEIIRAEGAWVESLFLADLGIRSVKNTEAWEFSDGCSFARVAHSNTARRVLRAYEVSVLLSAEDAPPSGEMRPEMDVAA